MMRKTARRALAITALLLASAPALAQNDKMVGIPTPAQPDAITLNTGPLPNAPVRESWHSQYGSQFARNVQVATLTPFLPDPAKASGAAVIVAPGGGFRSLSMENEGWDVAKALAARGVAAFVLKYRLNQTPADLAAFAAPPPPLPAGAAPSPQRGTSGMMAAIDPQIADARAAFALVRANAAKWKLDPAKIGMVGFSAGAMLTMATTLRGGDAKPAFIGSVYGGVTSLGDVPADAPPLFLAIAADDPLFPNTGGFSLVESWRAAKRPVELHYYEQGGHGFGMYPKTTTSTGWFDAFARWMTMHGWMKPAT